MTYTGDGHDYAVWYHGQIIDYVKATSDRKAANVAKQIWGNEVTVTKV